MHTRSATQTEGAASFETVMSARPIVVGLGGPEPCPSVLKWSLEVAGKTAAPLAVVRIFEPPFAEHDPESFGEMLDGERKHVEKLLADLGAAGEPVSIEVRTAQAVDALVEAAAGSDAFLVVVDAHDACNRRGFGSAEIHELLHRLHRPVAVIPHAYERCSGGTIVVGVDGSAANVRALEFATRFAVAIVAHVHAVFAYDPIDDTFTLPEGWHRHSDQIREELRHFGTAPVELLMKPGPAEKVLIDAAARDRAAAIVVGTRGRGGFHDLELGRVPRRLIRHAERPLIVVPHASASEHHPPTTRVRGERRP